MPSLAEIVKYLSGNVPGGILPYLYVILLTNLVFYVLGKHSELMDWKKVSKRLKGFTILFLFMYSMLWFTLRSESLKPRFMVFPTQSNVTSDYLQIPIFVDANLKKNIQSEFFYHPAKWIITSADKDSLLNAGYQSILANRLEADYWLTSMSSDSGLKWDIWKSGEEEPVESGDAEKFQSAFIQISSAIKQLSGNNQVAKYSIENIYPDAAELYWWSLNDSLDKVISMYEKLDTLIQYDQYSQIAYSHAIIRKAYEKKKQQQLISNPFKRDTKYKNWFIRGRAKMVEIGRNNPDNLDINLILADSYILEENYDTAELALKNAVVSDPYCAEMYYMFSFMDQSRYLDLKIENIQELLDKALFYDPLLENALVRYIEKIGEESITSDRYIYDFTVQKCLDFIELKPSSYIILNDLAGLYLIGGEFENAMRVSDRALKIAPNEETVIYNSGIIRYRLKKFVEALPFFTKLIDDFNHLDARLYRAMIYRKQEKYKEAVLDFRYRILNKNSDDDKYVKEAVKGIRQIRIDLAETGVDLDDIVPPYKEKR